MDDEAKASNTPPDTKGARIVANVLKSHGVKFVFYLCGTSVIPLAVELDKAGIRIVDTRHEATATFAAKTVGRFTGIPGVVLVTSGPGLTNTITAAQEASFDNTPLIVMSGAVATTRRGIGDLQDIDQVGIMKKICKGVFSIESKKSIVPTLRKAFQEACSNTPGPIYVQLPNNILETTSGGFNPLPLARSSGNICFDSAVAGLRSAMDSFSGNRSDNSYVYASSDDHTPLKVVYPKSNAAEITASMEFIKTAKKPLLIIGTQVTLRPKKIGQVTKALEDMGIPCFTLFMSKGILLPTHKLLLRQTEKMIQAQKDSDLVILAGVECDYTFRFGLDLPDRVISVNRSVQKGTLNSGKGKFWKLTQFVHSDVGYYLVRLARELKKNQFTVDENWIAQLKLRDSQYQEYLKKKKNEPSNGRINPLSILSRVNKTVVKDVVWVTDTGDFANTAMFAYISPLSPLSVIDSFPYGAVGGSAGYALGAKLCYPDREVWCIAGDGSCGYTNTEFDTFKRHNIHVIFVIGNDARWSEICRKQVEQFSVHVGCDLEYSKYNEIATTLGGAGFSIEKSNEADLEKTLMEASELSQSKSVLINVIMGYTNIRDGHV